ncbi:unnamed protein product, partial [Prorocentrum cordatum]
GGAGLRLLLVRHGESRNNALMSGAGMTPERWRAGREADPGLSEAGLGQAEALGCLLGGGTPRRALLAGAVPPSRLLVSPVRRAVETLRPTAERLGLAPEVWTECFEVGGIYHSGGTTSRGLARSELREQLPGCVLPEDVTEQGWYGLDGREPADLARGRA